MFYRCFLQSVACMFIFSIRNFKKQFSISLQSRLSLVFIYGLSLVSYLRCIICLIQVREDFLLEILQLGLTYRSVVCFELIFVYMVQSLFVCICTPSHSSCSLKRLYFLHEFSCNFDKAYQTQRCVGLLLDILSCPLIYANTKILQLYDKL